MGGRTTAPRGRTGPHPAQSASTGNSDSTASIVSALSSIVANLTAPRTPHKDRQRYHPYASESPYESPSTPRGRRAHRSPVPNQRLRDLSPIPEFGAELAIFLRDLHSERNVDMALKLELLEEEDYTPDVLPDVTRDVLAELLNIPDGTVMKIQAFAKIWNARLAFKKKVGDY
jgi:hypothetical protein